MYLYGVRSPANLGYYQRAGAGRGLGRLGFRPNQAVQRGVYRQKQPVNNGLRGYRGVGQDETDLFDTTDAPIATSLIPDVDTSLIPDTSDNYGLSTTLTPLATTTPTVASGSSMTYAPLTASDVTQQNQYSSLLAQGVPAATANAAATASSPAAATSLLTPILGAANAAAAVAKLAIGGGTAAPAASSALPGTIAGIPTTTVLVVGGLVLLLGVMSGGKR